jgi:hypothetical protein
MMTKVSGLIKAGAVMYMLWGVVHFFGVMNGLIYLTQGSDALLAAVLPQPPAAPGAVPDAAVALLVNHNLNLTVFGVLAIWCGVALWRGSRSTFWIALVILGLANLTFVIAVLAPGHVPLAVGILGLSPYVLGAVLTSLGFLRTQGADGGVPGNHDRQAGPAWDTTETRAAR